MSAIAFDIPEDIRAMRDGLRAFAEAEVLPRHDGHGAQSFRLHT